MIFFSIIIPTWKRKLLLKKIILKLLDQNFNYNFEIIICDSNSNDGTELLVKNLQKKKNKIIKYINISENSLSAKRNIGIKSAKGKYIILMDDDCIPANNLFLKKYYDGFNKANYKTILNGVVNYPKEFLNLNNFIKYRQSRHFSKNRRKKLWNSELNFKHMVVMNMAFHKNSILNKNICFNLNFWGYGSEDHDFAFQLKNKGFILKTCDAQILHYDKSSFSNYLTKIYHFGRDGMLYLKEYNIDAYNEIFLEKICFNFLKQKFFIKLYNKLIKLIIHIDKKYKFNIRLLYQIGIFLSYLLGTIDRKNLSKEIVKRKAGWYTKNFL